MAKSKAKKLRGKLQREGKINPDVKRSPFAFADMRTRTTKTKKDSIYKIKYKNHYSKEGNDGSFYFSCKWTYFLKKVLNNEALSFTIFWISVKLK